MSAPPYNPRDAAPQNYYATFRRGLLILGYDHGSPHREDWEALAEARGRGFIYGTWCSEACPEGELGSHHFDNLLILTKREYEIGCARFVQGVTT